MPQKFVVGLFESRGTAEDALNRLRTEGIPAHDVSLMMLRETASRPAVVASELAALEVDPFVVGDVRRTYATYIRNGETAIFVRAHSEAEVDLAVGTIQQYAPIKIRVVAPEGGTVLGHDVL